MVPRRSPAPIATRKDIIEHVSPPLTSRRATPRVPEVHNIFAEVDTVINLFQGTATATSGSPYRYQFVWILEMTGGLIVDAEAFLDPVAYQQVVDNTRRTRDDRSS